MAQIENRFSKEGYQRSCPHGSAVDYPVGTVHHVKIGDENCQRCPCYGGVAEPKPYTTIWCHYPHFNKENKEYENTHRPPSTHV